MTPALLIARREFLTYVATLSFWAALLISPLALAGAVLAVKSSFTAGPAPAHLTVSCPDPGLAARARTAFTDAARLEGQAVAGQPAPGPADQTARLACQIDPKGAVSWRLSGPIRLSPSGLALVARTLERDAARQSAKPAAGVDTTVVQDAAAPAATPKMGRFALLMVLWLVLTGSLGMLLQAVVRERSTRALEMLLASCRASDIVVGKLLGVGAVSVIVLATWLAGAALFASALPAATTAQMFGDLANPLALLRAALVYVLAFGFYGFIIIALGAGARDTSSAQNLSRPVFVILVAMFFVSMGEALNGAAAPAWRLFAPPLTPFALLLAGPGDLPPAQEIAAFAVLCLATAFCARWAIRCVTLAPVNPLKALPLRRRRRRAA
jgi:ABC-2 type transport system permease protein